MYSQIQLTLERLDANRIMHFTFENVVLLSILHVDQGQHQSPLHCLYDLSKVPEIQQNVQNTHRREIS